MSLDHKTVISALYTQTQSRNLIYQTLSWMSGVSDQWHEVTTSGYPPLCFTFWSSFNPGNYITATFHVQEKIQHITELCWRRTLRQHKITDFPNALSVKWTGMNSGTASTYFIRCLMSAEYYIQQYNKDDKLNETTQTLTRALVLSTSSGYWKCVSKILT